MEELELELFGLTLRRKIEAAARAKAGAAGGVVYAPLFGKWEFVSLTKVKQTLLIAGRPPAEYVPTRHQAWKAMQGTRFEEHFSEYWNAHCRAVICARHE